MQFLQSSMLLQISNGHDIITIMRSDGRKSKLITVFYSPLRISMIRIQIKDDMYVHSSNSAQHEKGFHTF